MTTVAPVTDTTACSSGTRKGAGSSPPTPTGSTWSVDGPHFLGHIIQHAVLDPRDGRTLLVAAGTGHLGPDASSARPTSAPPGRRPRRPPAFRTGERLARSLRKVFWLTPGHADEPGRLVRRAARPQGLFRSEDGGDTWAPVDGWNDHPMWETWSEYPEENTPDGSMLHSVIVDPRDADHLYLGLSAGGIFESTDGGKDWATLNQGVEAVFLPEPDADYGHDPHCVRLHPPTPTASTSRTTAASTASTGPARRGSASATTCRATVGDIGFPVELHPRDPDTAWVFPMDGTDVWPRTSPDGKPAVYVTRDAGAIVDPPGRRACPRRAWFTVKRQAMTTDDGDPVGRLLRHHERRGLGQHRRGRARGRRSSSTCPEIYSVESGRPAALMRVRIPTPLRSYTGEQSAVEADGTTVGELLGRPRPPVPRPALPGRRRAGPAPHPHEGLRGPGLGPGPRHPDHRRRRGHASMQALSGG